MALLPASLDRARDWAGVALDLAFPWPESVEEPPKRIEPPWCVRCGEPFPALEFQEADFQCYNCAERKWHFRWARAAYRTEGQVREAVIGFKYGDQYYRHRLLVSWLVEAYDRHVVHGEWDALVPVPLYHRRFRERGFNQAMEIARGLAKARNIRIQNGLYRYRETDSQARLSRQARWDNMAGAFRMKRGFDVKGRRLLLVDDVFTTGATVDACAHALARAGAADLAVLTIARS